MDELSERTRAILDYIAEHTAQYGYPPTVREIGQAIGRGNPLSTSVVAYHLRKLEEARLIERDSGKARAISLCAC